MDVAIVDPLPIFCHGLVAALGQGRVLASTPELEAWLGGARDGLLLLTMADEPAWAILRRLRAASQVHVVAVLPDFDISSAARALRTGAVHVLSRGADACNFRTAVEEVERGYVTVPVPVMRAVGALPDSPAVIASPTDDEILLLRELAAGSTVAGLADKFRYSERALYRRLKGLYRQLGVNNRTQALIFAREQGWL